jgi:hypothetical protein
MSNFPPHTTRESEVEAALGVLCSVVEEHGAVYVSAPITSGKRFAAWHARRGGGAAAVRPDQLEEFQREVVEHNRAHAKQIVKALRGSCAGVLIDPTALDDLAGWTQDDYRDLWARVIERHVCRVIFLDGWAYSNGCSYEFLVARRGGIATLDESQQPISLADGARLIQEAIAEMRGQALPTDFLECVLEESSKLRETETRCTK